MKNLLALFFISLLFSCENKCLDGNPLECLPEETQTGENTFGCFVDGNVFLEGFAFNVKTLTVNVDEGALANDGTLIIQCSNPGDEDEIGRYFTFHFEGINYEPQVINLVASENPLVQAEYSERLNGVSTFYAIDNNTNIGELTITRFDEVEEVISGTFFFKVVNDNDEDDIINIWNGRFDVTY